MRSPTTATSYFQATHVGADRSVLTLAGRYDDRMVLTAAGWLIAHETLTTLWVSGDPVAIWLR